MDHARKFQWLAAFAIAALAMSQARAEPPPAGMSAALLATGLAGGSGSTVGPGGALYVTEGAAGRISRVDPQTGQVTSFASGLPPSIVGIGGAMDVAFVGSTAYVLVTLVGSDVGGSDVVGLYRVDGPDTFTVLADLGTYSSNNPPDTPFDVPTGVQYALEPWRKVDVEFGRGRTLYALSQGQWDGVAPGSPALPDTGSLVKVGGEGGVTVIADGLDRPTSVEFIGNTAYVVTLGGEIWRIDGVSGPPYGARR